MAAKTSILTLGLDFDWSKEHRPMLVGPKPDEIIGALQEAFAQIEKLPGLYLKMELFAPDSEGKIGEHIHELIRNGPPAGSGAGKTWDGVLLGFGIRSDVPLTPAFEELVNFIKDTVPSARLMFSGMPDDQLPCVLRHFPHLKASASTS